ncbi:unnamed protein product [Adineta steineri]|uniref:PWWP domain-containing protein n=2 Tax=Adineta steineri TaxID=433720 RepID=A0A813X7G1_9BILA|nr:unnamed protein product [Adineta steineri]
MTIFLFQGQSKFTAVARALLKIARHEMIEIEICSECYLRSAQPLSTDWFAEPCKIPHTLCWAKMKGYQPWPAKVLRVVSDEVDVRFFGQHDRAWVSINNCFILSKEYPGLEKKKTNVNFEKSLTELQSHIDKLKTIYGHFNYAPLQTPLSKVKPFKFVSIIDDSIPPTYTTIGNNNNTLRSSVKCVKQARSPTLQPTTESAINTKTATKRSNENSQEQQESVKRARVLSRTTDDTNTNSNRIVLRIRKPSEDLSSGRSETSNCSSNHPLTIQIKEPLLALKEDEEEQTESQLINVFEIFDQTSDPSKNDDEMSCASPKNQICSPSSDTKLQSHTLINEYIDPNAEDVRLSMNALLDAVDALKSISEVRTNESLLTTTTSSTNESRPVQLQFAERRTTTKQPRKSRLQHRIITSQPKPLPPPTTTNVSLPSFEQHMNEQSLSPTPANVPLRPLSISPASADIFEDIATSTNDDLITQHLPLERTKSIETLSVKSEPIDNEEHKKSRVIQPIPSTQSSTPSSSTIIYNVLLSSNCAYFNTVTTSLCDRENNTLVHSLLGQNPLKYQPTEMIKMVERYMTCGLKEFINRPNLSNHCMIQILLCNEHFLKMIFFPRSPQASSKYSSINADTLNLLSPLYDREVVEKWRHSYLILIEILIKYGARIDIPAGSYRNSLDCLLSSLIDLAKRLISIPSIFDMKYLKRLIIILLSSFNQTKTRLIYFKYNIERLIQLLYTIHINNDDLSDILSIIHLLLQYEYQPLKLNTNTIMHFFKLWLTNPNFLCSSLIGKDLFMQQFLTIIIRRISLPLQIIDNPLLLRSTSNLSRKSSLTSNDNDICLQNLFLILLNLITYSQTCLQIHSIYELILIFLNHTTIDIINTDLSQLPIVYLCLQIKITNYCLLIPFIDLFTMIHSSIMINKTKDTLSQISVKRLSIDLYKYFLSIETSKISVRSLRHISTKYLYHNLQKPFFDSVTNLPIGDALKQRLIHFYDI